MYGSSSKRGAKPVSIRAACLIPPCRAVISILCISAQSAAATAASELLLSTAEDAVGEKRSASADLIGGEDIDGPRKRAALLAEGPVVAAVAPIAPVVAVLPAPLQAIPVSFQALCARRPVALATSVDEFVFSTLPPVNPGSGGAGVAPLPRMLFNELAAGQSGFAVLVRYAITMPMPYCILLRVSFTAVIAECTMLF
jgi:hypothetical protein